MRIAMLGTDDITLAVAGAAVRNGHDEIVLVDGSASRAAEAKAIFPAAQLIADWENAMDSNIVDAVLVAADQPTGEQPPGNLPAANPTGVRVEQLRRLIQVGMPVLVSHPISLSMLECYELAMIRDESRSVVLPYLPACWHPAAIHLREISEKSSADHSLEQVIFERFMPERNRETVLRQFARDADLLQFVAGDATKLHALGSSGTMSTGPYGNLAVQMTCDDGLLCRWTVAPVEDQPGGRLTLVLSNSKTTLWMPDDNSPWRTEIRTASNTTGKDYSGWDPTAMALEKLAAACDGQHVDPTWAEAARTVELTETIDRSLARGRTIDLHHEEFSEIGTFKGTMTSVGCGLLVAGLALAVFVALLHLLAVQAGWKQMAAKLDNWPYLLLGVCVIYLLLQPLVFIGKPRQKSEASTPNDGKDRGEGKLDKL
jgi:myo-inositol 2-dehydrogenase/D-chiro-inositol 1-dehydrogenase